VIFGSFHPRKRTEVFFGNEVKWGQAFVNLLLFLFKHKDSHSFNNKITGKARPRVPG
jgi:hypothetical protein